MDDPRKARGSFDIHIPWIALQKICLIISSWILQLRATVHCLRENLEVEMQLSFPRLLQSLSHTYMSYLLLPLRGGGWKVIMWPNAFWNWFSKLNLLSSCVVKSHILFEWNFQKLNFLQSFQNKCNFSRSLFKLIHFVRMWNHWLIDNSLICTLEIILRLLYVFQFLYIS